MNPNTPNEQIMELDVPSPGPEYLITDLLGEGATSNVRLGTKDDQHYAMKIFHLHCTEEFAKEVGILG